MTQPEALSMADWLEVALKDHSKDIASELRRLHEENETLKRCLKQMQDAAIELTKIKEQA